MVQLYWSEHESENDVAWNGYIDLPVVCLHWVSLTSDKDQREFSLSLSRSLQYNSALISHLPSGIGSADATDN